MERLEEISARLAGTWTFEVTALLTTTSSLVALIALLMVADGHSVVTWNMLTLNTMVSVLSTISRLSALYVFSAAIGQTKWNLFSQRPGSLPEFEAIDLASRGPFGCFMLLVRTRKIAFVGSLAVLVALAFDPFAQQLVQFDSEPVYSLSASTTMPVAHTYDAGSMSYLSMSPANENNLHRVNVEADFSMQSAVLGGFTHDSAAIEGQLPLRCGSGNCTWESVRSLAICSICNDVTSDLKRSIPTEEDFPAVGFISNEGLGVSSHEATAFTLATRVFLNNRDGPLSSSTWKILSMTAYGTGDPSQTTRLKDLDTLIWAMGMIRATPKTDQNASWPDDFEVIATECGLYYCVNEYHLDILNNIVNGSVRQVTDATRDPESWQFLDDGGKGLNASMKDSLVFPDDSYANERTDLVLRHGHESFNVSQTAVLSLSSFMNRTFTRGDTEPYNASDANNAYGLAAFYISDERPSRDGPKVYDQREPSVMQALYNSKNLSSTFEAVAASMSNAIRTHESCSENQEGNLGQLVTKYRIVWPWISLPALVVIASIAQLLMTILGSRRKPMWKNSTIATLSRGRFVGELFHDSKTINDFRVAAGEQDVYLFDNVGNSWQGSTTSRGGISMELREQTTKPVTVITSADMDASHESLLRTER